MRSFRQPVATHGNGSACLSRSSAGAICARLPPVATTGLHKGSILSCQRWRHDSRRRSRCSAFCVLLGCARVELEPDDGFVADDPGVVPGLDYVRLSRADLLLGSVIVDGVHRARLQQTDVVGLAALATY